MARDVREALSTPKKGKTTMAVEKLTPTRPEKAGYYVYDYEVDMQALANISRPIAVQCEKLMGRRYSLMDYILRTVIKACCHGGRFADTSVDVLLFEEQGEKAQMLQNVANLSIFQLSRHIQAGTEWVADFAPQIIVCDAKTTREQVAEQLGNDEHAPYFAFVTRGNSQKGGIQAGNDINSVMLPYTFYVSSELPRLEADKVAARLRSLLHDPVSLLFLN